MTVQDQLSQYTALLHIRQKARRRDARVIGGAFLLSVLATIAVGLLRGLQGREVYLLLGVLIAFGLGYLMSWVRLEIIKNALELADHLQRQMRAGL